MTGSTPQSVSIGDLDGDGKADLAVSNSGSNSISILHNTSSVGSITASSFATKIDFTTGSFPLAVSIGDLDGDGKADLAIVNATSNTVSILRNNPIPAITSFTPSSGSTGANITIKGKNFTGTTAVSIGGTPVGSFAVVNDTSITAVVGGGTTGTLAVKTPVGTATSAGSFTVIPLPPPVITSFSPLSGPIGTSVTITGTNFNTTAANNIVFFGATMATVANATSTSLTVSVPTGATYQNISVLNTANGLSGSSAKPFNVTFKGLISAKSVDQKIDFTTGSAPVSVAVGDLDGDGKADLAVGNNNSANVSIFRNTSSSGAISTSSFAPKVDFSINASGYAVSVNIGDLDGDGKSDLAVVDQFNGNVCIFRNTSTIGTISFAAKVIFATNGDPQGGSIGDLDGDGRLDLAVTSFSTDFVSVLHNTSSIGTISFAAKVNFATGSGPISVSISDLDGDGKADLAVNNEQSNTVSVFRNTSTSGSMNASSFAAKVDFAAGSYPEFVSIGDLDGDGKPDLAVANYSGSTISILQNTSSIGSINASSFAAKVSFATATGSYPRTVSIGDLDGDGKPDLATANYNGSGNVSIFRNTTSIGSINASSFASKIDFTVGSSPTSVSIGDLDGDGKPDLAVADIGSNTVSVLRNNPAPDISSFTPSSGNTGTTITITGKNFTGTTAISIGGTAVGSFTVVNDTSITAVAGNGNTGKISLSTPVSNTISTNNFTFPINYNNWLGNSSDWNAAANWSNGIVPTSTDHVSIGVTSNNPIISSGGVSVDTIGIASGASLTIYSGSTLTVPGGITNNGNICNGGTITATIKGKPANPIPTVNPVTPAAICSGTSTNITLQSTPAGAVFTYGLPTMTGVSGGSPGSVNPINQTLTTTGNISGTAVYAIIATLAGCNSIAANINQTVNPQPSVNAGTDGTVCANNQIIALNATFNGATGVMWSGGNGTYSPDNLTPNAMYTPSAAEVASGSIALEITTTGNGTCTAAKDTVVYTIISAPTVNAGPDQTVCADNSQITLDATFGGASGVQWSGGNGTFSDQNASYSTYTFASGDIAAGTITLIITTTGNGNCNASADSVNVTITAPPTINAGPDMTICANNLPAALEGSGSQGQWSGGNGTFSNRFSQSTNYTPSPAEITAGSVTLTLTSTSTGSCPQVSDDITITINPVPTISTPSHQISLCTGDTTSIRLHILPNTTINWSPALVSGTVNGYSSGSDTLIAQALSGNGKIAYAVNASLNSCNSADTIYVSVNPVPTMSITNRIDTICAGNKTNIILNSPDTGTTFNWTISATGNVTGANTGTGDTIAQTLTGSGSINYMITPSIGGTCYGKSDTATVKVKRDQVINFPVIPAQFLHDKTLILSASSTTTNTIIYTSSNSSIASVSGSTATFLKSGTITITAYQAPDNCYNGDTVSRQLQINALIVPQLIVNPIGTITYGDYPAKVRATINPLRTLTYTSLDPAIARFKPGTDSLIGLKQGRVQVIVSSQEDNMYAAVSDTQWIQVVRPDFQILSSNYSHYAAYNSQVNFSISPVGQILTYKWVYNDPAGNTIRLSPSDNLPVYNLVFLNASISIGTLTCVVHNPYVSQSDSLIFMVYMNKDITENQLPNVPCDSIVRSNNACKGVYISRVDLNNVRNISTECSYVGFEDNTRSPYKTELYLGESYSATIRVASNKPADNSPNFVRIWIDYNNDGDFDDPNEFIMSGSSSDSIIKLNNIIITNNIEFAGLRRLRVKVLDHPFASDDNGCLRTAQADGEAEDYRVLLDMPRRLEAPVLISPNDDGKNDLFVIRGIDTSKDNKLMIIDRQGALLYSMNNYANTWGGISKDGILLPKDTYYYVFTNGEDTLKGYFEIRY